MEKPKFGPYSPNRFKVFTCGYAAERLYVNPDPKFKEYDTLPQARGSAVHAALATATLELASGRENFTSDEIKKWVADGIRQYPASLEETKEVLRMTRGYLLNQPLPFPKDTEVEQGLAVTHKNGKWVECDYDDPDAYVRGRADIKFVSDDLSHATIIDHKTQKNIEDADTFQLGVYAWMMFKINPYLQEVHTILNFAFHGCTRTHIWQRDQLQEIEDEIDIKIQVCEEFTEWTPQPHSGCQYCPFITECPALAPLLRRDENGKYRPNMDTLEILGDTYKAVQVAGLVVALRALEKHAHRSVRSHVESSGAAIASGDQEFAFVAKTGVIDWDYVNEHLRPETYAIFEKHNEDPKAFMGFSQTHSKRIDRAEKPALAAELNALFPRKTVTEFRVSKVKKPWPSFPEGDIPGA